MIGIKSNVFQLSLLVIIINIFVVTISIVIYRFRSFENGKEPMIFILSGPAEKLAVWIVVISSVQSLLVEKNIAYICIL